MSATDSSKQEREHKGRSAVEIAVLSLCSALLLFMLGYAMYHAATASGTPPILSATPIFDEVTLRGKQYALPVEVVNETSPTAQNVRVVATIARSNGQAEEMEARVQYLPEHSRTRVYVLSAEKPTRLNTNVEVESYQLQ